jgi:hypothetical protein
MRGWRDQSQPCRQAVWPLPWKEASAEAVSAVAYAAKYHGAFGASPEKGRLRSFTACLED